MIKVDELKLLIYKNGLSQRKVAHLMGLSAKTFYAKMKHDIFYINEIQTLIEILHINDPVNIFFADSVA